MTPRHLLLAAGAAGALAAPAPALAAWTTPVTIDARDQANQVAQRAYGGSILTGWLAPVVSLAKREGDGFGKPAPLTVAVPYERAWAAALDDRGEAIVLTLRRRFRVQRIRATFGPPGGARHDRLTASDLTPSESQPRLDAAPDGTAVAAWQ